MIKLRFFVKLHNGYTAKQWKDTIELAYFTAYVAEMKPQLISL